MSTPFGSRSGTLNITGEHDWLKLSLSANTLYQVTSTLTSTNFTVFDASGAPVGVSEFATDTTGNALGFMPKSSGTYYIDVGAAGSGSQAYSVSVATVTDDYRNNTGTTGTLNVGGSTAGNIDTANEHDWFKVTLSANTLYQLSSTLSYGFLMMLDASGNFIPTIDAYGNKLGFMPTASGTYFVDLFDAGGNSGAYTVSLATVTDDYYNNTGTTGAVNVGGSASGVIHAAGEHDWFRVNLSGNTLYEITHSLTTGMLAMFDASGTPIAAIDAWGTSLGYMPATSGTYYIDISDPATAYGGSPTNSVYSVSIGAVTDDYFNNTSTTGAIAVGGTTNGTVNVGGEHDWLKASLSANTLYAVTSTLMTGQLMMYDASGNLVGTSDAQGSSLGFMPASSGTYYIDVWDYASQYGGLGGDGTYAVTLTSVVDDYRNNTGTNGIVSVGGSATGTLNTAGDHDWFKVTLTADTLYQITSTLSYGQLEMYDATGNAVDTLDASGTSLGFMPATSGLYYIDVSETTLAFTPAVGGSSFYTLSVSTATDDFTNNVRTSGSVGSTGGTGGSYTGTSGNDRMVGTAGNDTFNGLGGIDTVMFGGNRASYTLSQTASGYTVSGGLDGTDTLSSIERLEFADKKVALDLTADGHTGQALEFIGMLAYPVVTDPGTIGLIQGFFDGGYTMTALCQTAIDIGLIDQLAGSASDVDLARLVFLNVVGSEADAATAQSIASLLQTSGGTYSRVDFLAAVAALDLNQTHIDLVGLQATGVEYLA